MAFVLDPAASVEREIQRVATECLDEALELLQHLDANPQVADIEQAVHSARKRCKEVRAIARLVRPRLGDEFGRFNRLVRDAADELAPIRDAHAMLATFDKLRSGAQPDRDLDRLQSAQAATADAETNAVSAGDPRITSARLSLSQARASVGTWRIDDRTSTLGVGIEATYRAGRRNLRRARNKPNAVHFHEWRKSVKHLWYQIRLIRLAAPSALGPMVKNLNRMADALGDEHDLSVLIDHLTAAPDRFGGSRNVEHMVDLASARQHDLRQWAIRLGITFYAEKPTAFTRRIGSYWNDAIEHGPEQVIVGQPEQPNPTSSPRPASASSTIERERKFLVADLPTFHDPGTDLRQGYLAIDGSVAVRVRAAANEYMLNVKAGSGAVRTELESPISEEQFEAAWQQTGSRRIDKTRYLLTFDDHVIEVDVFHGEMDGLVVAEVEFESEEAMAAFVPLPWFGTELTDDMAYTNASLAVNGLPPPTSD